MCGKHLIWIQKQQLNLGSTMKDNCSKYVGAMTLFIIQFINYYTIMMNFWVLAILVHNCYTCNMENLILLSSLTYLFIATTQQMNLYIMMICTVAGWSMQSDRDKGVLILLLHTVGEEG